MEQALGKVTRSASVPVFNEKANCFFRSYKKYQMDNYKNLHITTNDQSNGYWVYYKTNNSKKAYIYHKLGEGEVKLIFNGKSDKMNVLLSIREWLAKNGYDNIRVAEAGKSASLMAEVPKLNMEEDFSKYKDKAGECMETIEKMTELANCFNDIASLYL